jgi:nucleotide-binding universal stress UspA family protein
MIQRRYEKDRKIVAEAGKLANHARQRLQKMFPRWTVTAEATYGSPAWAILDRADELKTDLIVVGSHGRGAVTRFFLGSISQKVLTEARCSVRVARGRIEVDPSQARIVIGFDGSKGALAAVDSVASRQWPDRSDIRLIVATDEVVPSTVGSFIPQVAHLIDEINGPEREWIKQTAEGALTKLRSKNLSPGWHIHAGNPKEILVEEATRWNADCIFVGANAYGTRLERFLLGSTSAAVAARAHCSVEVVRI